MNFFEIINYNLLCEELLSTHTLLYCFLKSFDKLNLLLFLSCTFLIFYIHLVTTFSLNIVIYECKFRYEIKDILLIFFFSFTLDYIHRSFMITIFISDFLFRFFLTLLVILFLD